MPEPMHENDMAMLVITIIAICLPIIVVGLLFLFVKGIIPTPW